MNAYDRRVLWVSVASAATQISVERDGVGDFGVLLAWLLILGGCWIARHRAPAWLIVAITFANVLFASAASRSSVFLACAAWFTCAALGLFALEHRRERERAMLLPSTDPPGRSAGGATFVLSALLCTIPLYLFVPKPAGWLVGERQTTTASETRPARAMPETVVQSAVRDSAELGAPLPASSARDAPASILADIAPARPEDGAYGEEFAIDSVTRNTRLANVVVAYVKSSRPLNLRGQLYDRFENNRWRREPQSFADHALERGVLELPTPRFGVDPIRQSIDVVRTLDVTLPHAPGVRRLRFPGENVRRYVDDVFVLPRALQAHTTYSVDSELTLLARRYALAEPDTRPHAGYLDTSELSVRQRALAQRVTASVTSARDKAFALEAFLRSEYAYSYETIAQQGYTPLDRFLFETKRGHCEYFASALAMLLRAVDVPSRVATGFSLSAPNPVTGYYEVKALDGHAWVEAFVDGQWLMLEPTPFYPLPRYREAAQVADQLDDYLSRLVQTHELLDPASLETRAVRLARDAWQVARDIMRTIAQLPMELGWIFPIALLLGALAAALAYLALLALTDGLDNRELRATLRRAAVANGRDGTLLTAAVLERAAKSRGVERHAGASFREYLAVLAEAGYQVSEAFADDFDVARYATGDASADSRSLRDVREVIEQRLAADPWPRMRRAVSPLRRWTGVRVARAQERMSGRRANNVPA